ncbi:MAG: hypothetical protein J6X70_07280 [Muribaculaceae bacterium]|nr:hypothetical protein [Muribaculaceae bacterium]
MDGVVLFADNRIFSEGKENALFKLFLSNPDLSVLPIDSLACFESTIKSASTFRACIIDWDFENNNIEDEDFAGLALPKRTPMSLLMENSLYTLVYVYSEKELPEDEKTILSQKYNHKIQFRTKSEDVQSEYQNIFNDILTFEANNAHMNIPFVWSQSINKSAQAIFNELESANAFWIKEIRENAIVDGGDATSEVIDVFNNLLNEDLIQNQSLRGVLDSFECNEGNLHEDNTAKLYRRIYYSNIVDESPVMTGDIFQFDDDKYGILITPECEIADKNKEKDKEFYDFLIISKSTSKKYQEDKQKKYSKDVNNAKSAKDIFNNGVISRHILISFPFDNQVFNQIGLIEFNTAFRTMPKIDGNHRSILECRTNFKLNSPYIHQLRQRFVSYFGKYGVPAIPNSLREYNLKKQSE